MNVMAVNYIHLRGDLGMAVVDEIGGSDKYDDYLIELKSFTPYVITLVGLGSGDLDLYLLDPVTKSVISKSNSGGNGEILLFKTGLEARYILRVRVYSGYAFEVDPGYVITIVPKPISVTQRG